MSNSQGLLREVNTTTFMSHFGSGVSVNREILVLTRVELCRKLALKVLQEKGTGQRNEFVVFLRERKLGAGHFLGLAAPYLDECSLSNYTCGLGDVLMRYALSEEASAPGLQRG